MTERRVGDKPADSRRPVERKVPALVRRRAVLKLRQQGSREFDA
jgi:hypothetical protein